MSTPPPRRVEFVVPADAAGLRLDQLLAAQVPGLSRRQARVAIDIGGVFVDGGRVKVASRVVRPGRRVSVTLGRALEQATKDTGAAARARDAAALPPHRIVHEDDDVVVVDKPAGLLVAPTAESDRGNLAALLAPRAERLHVVHRIDAPTSGLVVFAKTTAAAGALSRQFAAHTVEREYEAVVAGRVPDDRVTVDAPIGGRRAVTRFTVVERFGDRATRLRCRLETGRTHQIRIHARRLGHPVLGDRVHGTPTHDDPPRLALHATTLAFTHPRRGERLAFASPWPDDVAAWLASRRGGGADLPTPPSAS
jgi:23S rRNA pseudouridine1911/1915/1917 synthase